MQTHDRHARAAERQRLPASRMLSRVPNRKLTKKVAFQERRLAGVLECGCFSPLWSSCRCFRPGSSSPHQPSSAWGYRQHAGAVATDAAKLEVVASARAHMNRLELPLTAVAYARQVGISEPELDTLLHPTVPFRDQITQQLAAINRYPTFSSTSVLQADVAALPGVILSMAEGSVAYGDVRNFLNGMAAEIDRVWSRDYQRLQADIAAWQPPGSFEVHTSALRQTYQAFQAGGHEIEGTIYVLEGTGPSDAKQELIQASGVFDTATAEFAGQLSPKAHQAWHRLQTNSVDRHFAATVQQALTVVLKNLPPPFVGNVAFAGASFAPGLHYLADLNALVTQHRRTSTTRR